MLINNISVNIKKAHINEILTNFQTFQTREHGLKQTRNRVAAHAVQFITVAAVITCCAPSSTTTSCRSTDSERPHRCRHLPDNCDSRRIFSPGA